MTLDEFFTGYDESRLLFDALCGRMDEVGPTEWRVTKSQVSFRRRRAFAWAWNPARYLRGQRPPLVLSLALPQRDASPRWKEIVEPRPGRFMHHLELNFVADVDDEVGRWLHAAWQAAD